MHAYMLMPLGVTHSHSLSLSFSLSPPLSLSPSLALSPSLLHTLSHTHKGGLDRNLCCYGALLKMPICIPVHREPQDSLPYQCSTPPLNTPTLTHVLCVLCQAVYVNCLPFTLTRKKLQWLYLRRGGCVHPVSTGITFGL